MAFKMTNQLILWSYAEVELRLFKAGDPECPLAGQEVEKVSTLQLYMDLYAAIIIKTLLWTLSMIPTLHKKVFFSTV